MKKLKYNWIVIFISIVTLSGCSDDFLDKKPVDAVSADQFYQTDEQIMASTALLYNKVWFDYNDKASFKIGDLRSGVMFSPWGDQGFVKFNTTGDNSEVIAAWSSFFTVIGQSNLAIENINRYAGPLVSESTKKRAIAEARFMRACAYRNLVLNWGEVPIITKNETINVDYSIKRNTVPSVWRFITNEMRAVVDDLPENPTEEGRVSKWSAEGMLARFYLTRAGVESEAGVRKQEYLDSAKYYSDRVIDLSGKILLPEYASLFKYPYDNNKESLFELQWVYASDVWGVSNSAPTSLSFSNDITDGAGWGGGYGMTWWMLQKYDNIVAVGTDGTTLKGNPNDKRLHETFMLPGYVYPEISQKTTLPDGSAGYKVLVYPNNTGDNSFAAIKKYIVGQSVDLDGESSSQHYPNDTYMLRLAEMYLIYAEAVLGNQETSSDAKALGYINLIRKRAGVQNLKDPNANSDKTYFTYDDVFNERLVEFAMEGMFWYDLSNLYYFNKQKALDILNSQDRGQFAIYTDQYPAVTVYTFTKTSWSTDRTIVANEGNFYLPIPTAELATAPNLLEPAVDYYK